MVLRFEMIRVETEVNLVKN